MRIQLSLLTASAFGFLVALPSCDSSTAPSGPKVGSVEISQQDLDLPLGAEVQLVVVVRDTEGAILAGRTVEFSTSNPGVATVTSSGLVTSAGAGPATITATVDGVRGTSSMTGHALSFASITAGYEHNCGLNEDGRIWCWGSNYDSQLGIGERNPTGDFPQPVETALTFQTVDADGSVTCGVTAQGQGFCWGYVSWGTLHDSHSETWSIPTETPGGLTFKSLNAQFCGLTPENRAFCWGVNQRGELGTGDVLTHDTFVPVSGGLLFEEVADNTGHGCGIAMGGDLYCWGNNEYGTLGTGDRNDSGVPVAVTGGLSFRSLPTAQNWASCGITVDYDAYCWGWWGWNNGEEFTIQGSDTRDTPTPIPGGLKVATMGVGRRHGCVATPEGAPYCWGSNEFGQLGDGTRSLRTVPTSVSGGHSFVQIVAGGNHSCGLEDTGAVYCWGDNSRGQLGVGSTPGTSDEPLRVFGAG
jgi:hypothetical protein